MMLHFGQDHMIAGIQIFSSPAIGYQINRFGGIPSEYNLRRRSGMNPSPNFFARCFMSFRRQLREMVNPPMNIGIVRLIVSVHCFENG